VNGLSDHQSKVIEYQQCFHGHFQVKQEICWLLVDRLVALTGRSPPYYSIIIILMPMFMMIAVIMALPWREFIWFS